MAAMKARLALSASELSSFSECQRLTWLNAGVARGERELPGRNELERWMLEHRGRAHEARLLEWYRRQGKRVVELSPAPARDEAGVARAMEATWAALEGGAEVVYQGTLRHEGWTGRPDFLMRVPGGSRLGSFHYEVVDAKLARHAQARSILQLCAYTEQLGALQARLPERFWIAVGGSSASGAEGALEPVAPIECRTDDYLAYYRRTRRRFEQFVAEAERAAEPYPEPVEHCDICRWWKDCEGRRRADDHVSLVAGSTRRQRDRLALVGVTTAAQLAQLAPERAPQGIEAGTLERLREQARLQLSGRAAGKVLHELLHGGEPGTGLERLPLPTPGDLFLDLEGDAYALGEGLEYLFGLLELGEPSLGWSSRTEPGPPRYQVYWAQSRAEEKRAFEAVIRRIERGLVEFPGLHVFHFGQREVDALRRLSCRHASMEAQVDRLLREHVLVDLHSVVKQSVRASVESYTLKELEALYGFTRDTAPRRAALSMQRYGFWLETGEALSDLEEERRVLERYNADDCRSLWQLRGWLEQRRAELEQSEGRTLSRPAAVAGELAESRKERSKEATLVVEQLQTGLPEDPGLDTPEQHGKRVLSHLVGWHWREQKSAWWEYYRATELAPSERLEDRSVLDGLSLEKIAGKVARSQVFRYRFPEQEYPRRGPWRDLDSNKNVEVLALGSSHVDIKRGAKLAKEPHPRSLTPVPIDSSAQEKSVLCIAQSVARYGLASGKRGAEAYPAARALLLRQPPRCGQAEGARLLDPDADTVQGVVSLALALEPGVLAVQGPPGSGKTHRAAAAIVALLRAGKRVGITANSHQVITDLLGKCCTLARSEALVIGAHHIDKLEERVLLEGESGAAAEPAAAEPAPEAEQKPYSQHDDHERVAAGLRDGSLQLVGATSYAWARELYQDRLDVLVVDEAAQISLANVIAVSPAAPRLILFGDPAQLEQPQRGVHPPGADLSALEYLLGDALTMPEELGVFLAETRRLHPELCKFTSRVFYEGRLHAQPGLEEQAIVLSGAVEPQLARLAGAGLRFVPVLHRGNTQRSEEEVERVVELVTRLLVGGFQFAPAGGAPRALAERDVLVVAPYNAQVAALRRRLPPRVAVGTVDKFQGREAPIVIYSLTSSSASDAPRGLEFLYSLNRLNVATSRARALVILVGSPELAQAHCRSPRQMQLVNALCSYLELVPGLAE